jgi:hypothetical protein
MTDDLPAPRDVYDYERGEAVEGAFLEALARGRLHHAWLLTGPEGVGKATIAPRDGCWGPSPTRPLACWVRTRPIRRTGWSRRIRTRT